MARVVVAFGENEHLREVEQRVALVRQRVCLQHYRDCVTREGDRFGRLTACSEDLRARRPPDLKGAIIRVRCSRCGAVVLVDEAAEPVAAVDLVREFCWPETGNAARCPTDRAPSSALAFGLYLLP